MDLFDYIAAIEEFGPALTELGYELGDFNDQLPVIHVSGHGLSTYVHMDDRAQLEALVDPSLHAERIAPPPEAAPQPE